MRQNLAEKIVTSYSIQSIVLVCNAHIQTTICSYRKACRRRVLELLAPIIHLKHGKYQNVSALVCDRYLLVADSYPVAFGRRKRGDAEDFEKEMRGAQRVMGRTSP